MFELRIDNPVSVILRSEIAEKARSCLRMVQEQPKLSELLHHVTFYSKDDREKMKLAETKLHQMRTLSDTIT